MKKRGVESIELPAAEESFESVRSYFRRRLEAEDISKALGRETLLIGTMILLQFTGFESPIYVFVAFFSEAVLGILQNLINAAGDVVTVTIEEQKQKGRRHGQND